MSLCMFKSSSLRIAAVCNIKINIIVTPKVGKALKMRRVLEVAIRGSGHLPSGGLSLLIL